MVAIGESKKNHNRNVGWIDWENESILGYFRIWRDKKRRG